MKLRDIVRIGIALALLSAGVMLAHGQTQPFPVTLEKQLASRATNYTEVSLDKNMLAFASKFLNSKDGDDAEAKRLISRLDGVYVRTYEFDKPGQYTPDDLEAVRRQIQSTEWSPMVKSRSKSGEGDSDIFLKVVNGDIHGLFVLNAEPKELTFVYIAGPIHPEELTELGGNFGIPKMKVDKDKLKGKEGH
jgi:hypothetical protein